MSKGISFDFKNVMAKTVGEEHGVSERDLRDVERRIPVAHKALEGLRESGKVAFYDLPYRKASITRVKSLAKKLRGKFESVVVFGIGGSALGTIALKTALCHPLYNELRDRDRKAPKLYVEDNIDPVRLSALMDVIEPKKTLFVVISKSGSTVETMSQFLLAHKMLKGKLKNNVVAITDEVQGSLRPIADSECLASLEVPDGVGGRFSVLSPVGLFPAAMCGIDIEALVHGAADADRKRCSSNKLSKNDAYMAAAIEYILYNKGKRMSVMMPYASGLRDLADWYCQLWAESLGKTPEIGPTPIKALGVTDQHSQVQLYREGPNDKVYCFVGVEKYAKKLVIPEGYPEVPALNYIGGHTFNELMNYERIGTTLALTDANRPNYTITFPQVGAYEIGEFFHMLSVKTAMAGQLFGVDAFNQPGVEAGKVLAYGLMGRDKYIPAKRWIHDKQAGRKVVPLDEMMRKLK